VVSIEGRRFHFVAVLMLCDRWIHFGSYCTMIIMSVLVHVSDDYDFDYVPYVVVVPFRESLLLAWYWTVAVAALAVCCGPTTTTLHCHHCCRRISSSIWFDARTAITGW
jgi:hypothetical protein